MSRRLLLPFSLLALLLLIFWAFPLRAQDGGDNGQNAGGNQQQVNNAGRFGRQGNNAGNPGNNNAGQQNAGNNDDNDNNADKDNDGDNDVVKGGGDNDKDDADDNDKNDVDKDNDADNDNDNDADDGGKGGKGGGGKGGGGNQDDGDNDGDNDGDGGDNNDNDNDNDGDGDNGGDGGKDGGDNDDGGDGGEGGGDDDDDGGGKGGGKGSAAAQRQTLRCQDTKGRFLPIATVCRDEMPKSFCKRVFPKNPSNPGGRPHNCDLHGLEDVVYKCAHHCKICCELASHGCGDDPTYHINCENRKHLCHKLTSMMTSACAATCGLCHHGPCADTINGCIGLRAMCKHHGEFPGDIKNCARTCGLCLAKCVDLSNDCPEAEQTSCYRPPDDHPEENPYYDAMSRVCRRRCDLCGEPMPMEEPLPPAEQDKDDRDGGGRDGGGRDGGDRDGGGRDGGGRDDGDDDRNDGEDDREDDRDGEDDNQDGDDNDGDGQDDVDQEGDN